MYLTLNDLARWPLAERAELFQKVMVQHAGKFFYVELNALGQTILGEIPEQIRQLQSSPTPSPWARPIILRVSGDMDGTVELDGTQDVKLEVKLNHEAISVEDIDGLGMILLGMQRTIEETADQIGNATTAKALAAPITIEVKGDVTGKLEKFDGSSNVSFTVSLSETLRNQLKNSFLGTIALENADANEIGYQGTVAITGGVNFPQSEGLLWNAVGPRKNGAQFFQGANGRMWHRTITEAKNTEWTEVITRATFDPASKADRVDALGVVAESKDLFAASTGALGRWTKGAKNAPTDRGVYLETISANGRRAPIVGNQIDRLMFSADGRIFHQQSVDNADWKRREFYHTDNFKAADKADLSNPSFLTGIGIYPGSPGTGKNLMHAGWQPGKHRWKLELESDASITINAFSSDQKEQHRLLRLRSRVAGGKSEIEALVNRTRIGLGDLTAIYGFAHDDWGLFSTKTTLGFTDGKKAVTYVTKHDRTLVHEGPLEVGGRVEATRVYAQWDAGVTGGISCDNWFRSAGPSGWMNSTYGGGWYMTDEKYIRAYNEKRVLAGGFSMSFKNVNRSTIRELDYQGALKPIRFLNIAEGVQDYGFDLENIRQQYPEAIETRNGLTCVSVNAIGAILSAQNNKLEQELGDTRSELDQLRTQMDALQQRLDELGL